MTSRQWLRLALVLAVIVVLGFIAQQFLDIDVTGMASTAVRNDLAWVLLVVVAFALGRWSARPARTRPVDERDRARTGRP